MHGKATLFNFSSLTFKKKILNLFLEKLVRATKKKNIG